MKKQYDYHERRLAYFNETPDFNWDQVWEAEDVAAVHAKVSPRNLVNRITRKYLKPTDGPVLEAGCGPGQYVRSLSECGYTCVGIDLAENTILEVKRLFPELDVHVMDVRNVRYPDSHFAGCWSLGVVEHFRDGYGEALDEMSRVVMPGGYVFLTVPVMSPLRRSKSHLGLYQAFRETESLEYGTFYQYALSPKKVIDEFCSRGFAVVTYRLYSGILGLREEVEFLRAPLARLHKIRTTSRFANVVVTVLDRVLSPLTGHICLFVFRKCT